jgi:hypothetical protein
MARNKGTFNFSANFEPLLKAPLDARQVVGVYADLTNPSTWRDSADLVWLYNGLIVGVGNDTDPSLNGVYFLKDADNYDVSTNWVKVGGGAEIDLTALMTYIDGSLALRDTSLNDLYNQVFTINASISRIDGSINVIFPFLNQLDASIQRIDGSINSIFNYLISINASIGNINTSIGGLELRIQSLEASIAGGPFVKEASLGSGFVWDASGYLDVSVAGGGAFTGDVSTTHVFYETFLDPSLAMPSSVGGIPSGTRVYDLKGDTLTSILNDLLFPTQYPTLTGPSGSIAVAPTTLIYEVSANINLTFTSTLNRGSISPQYSADSPYRSGLPNNYNFTGIGLIDISSSTTPYISAAFDASIPLGSLAWNVAIGYDGGVQPFNNKGIIYDSSLAPGTVNSNTITIIGVYPLFASTVTIGVMTKQSLVAMTTAGPITLAMVAESGGNKQAFEVPNAWIGTPTNNPLTGIITLNSVSGLWEYELGNAALSLTRWTTSSVTETIQGSIINYTKYTYNGPDRSTTQIRLEF